MCIIVQEVKNSVAKFRVELVNEHDQKIGEVIEQLQNVGHGQRYQVQIGRVDFAVGVHDYDEYVAQDAKDAYEWEEINTGDLAHDHVEVLVVLSYLFPPCRLICCLIHVQVIHCFIKSEYYVFSNNI